jgi:hypothetical protein
MTAKSAAMAMVTIMVMGITMILPTYSFAQTTEDDGYTYDSDNPEEQQEQDEEEQEAWEDAGRPGDDDDSGNGNGNDDDGPNPYCDKVPDNHKGACHDRKDYYQGGPKNGLYPCNDGIDKADWRDCKDATKNNNDNDNGGSDSNPAPEIASSAPTIETTTALINATAEEEAAENACSAIGNGDAKKYTLLTFTKKMWADACPWLSGYDQAYVGGYVQGSMQKLGITDETDNTCLKFVQDTMRKTFH